MFGSVVQRKNNWLLTNKSDIVIPRNRYEHSFREGIPEVPV